jgi:hypothetical protein
MLRDADVRTEYESGPSDGWPLIPLEARIVGCNATSKQCPLPLGVVLAQLLIFINEPLHCSFAIIGAVETGISAPLRQRRESLVSWV